MKLSEHLKRVSLLVTEWEERGEISEIERSILVDELKYIYNKVVFDSTQVDKQHESVEERVIEVVVGNEAEQIVGIVVDEEESKAIEDTVIGLVVELEPKLTLEKIVDIFGEDEDEIEYIGCGYNKTPRTNKIDRSKINAIYGDDDDSSFKLNTTKQEIEIEVQVRTEEKIEGQKKTTISETTTTVLGDVMSLGAVIGETMMANEHLGSKVCSGTITDLHKVIQINDKFLLCRDLFDNNEALYGTTIDTLNKFESIEDAMLYIHDNFSWSPNSEGSKLIMELLGRKFL